MAAFIRSVLSQINSEIARVLSPQVIERICHDLNYSWRRCTLDPTTTVYAFLRQILEGNTACDHVPILMGLPLTGEAYCKARSRLPVELFQQLMKVVGEAVAKVCEGADRWSGHHVWYIDGSSHSMPDTPVLQEYFGQPTNQLAGCGFPVAHLMTLFHAATGCLLRITLGPLRSHDLPRAQSVHDRLHKGDIVVADRGFCSFVHLALLMAMGVFAVFRLHQKTIVSFRRGRGYLKKRSKKKSARSSKGKPTSRWVKWLGTDDQIVEYFKPKTRPRWMTAAAYALLPESFLVRELRYRVTQRGYRVKEVLLVTTLLDAERYPAAELAKLYQQRWEIETNLRHLKQTLKMDVLHTKSVEGIQKELAMFFIVYNIIRLVMVRAAKRQNLDVRRISFIDAQRQLARALDGRPIQELLVVPDRPSRAEPRVRKRRPKKFPSMRKTRQQWKQDLLT